MNQLIPITQLALPIPAPMSDAAWQQAQAGGSIEAMWNVYLNQIATELLCEDLAVDFPQIRVWPDADIWQFVNGSVLELNNKRLVLLPSRAIDNSELVIPQEWVDIPAWAGDYFLAVQIDPDAELLHCWGYTTHQMLKSKARYDAVDRTYHLDAYQLIADVSGLWAIQELNPTEVTQAAIAPLASVATTQAENLLQRLATVPDPRLEIPFGLWGALASDRTWRSRLVELRQGATSSPRTAANRLGDWLQNAFATGWQAVEDFLGEDAELAFALRQTATATPIVRRVKALQLPDCLLLLLVSVEVETADRLSIQVQLRADDRTATLPAGICLELLSSDDEVVRSVVARDRDNAIQLPRFRSESGTGFKIQVRSGETTVCESFLV
ncbi:DUF1822 family protein [Chamaesiphon polymorphus]|uniref:DUF1822 domain-containing protein n=1 Tax=Chamaesiphon polymorphus CCALA 037 TaxID=2107692 RepID=A0A2T1GE77_9CYAN|nr:DUF1822 family protein [Chamaesiphon polymorphus]PSB55722.1 hypothetical protein C7B77_14105 [Chamaesiphon polymorphus CCALA 037]